MPASILNSSSAAWSGFEVFRGICVLGMVWVHAFYFMVTEFGTIVVPDSSPVMQYYRIGMLLGCLPMWLPFCGGIALGDWFFSRPSRSIQLWHIICSVTVTWLLGGLMNVASIGWRGFADWNVLQFFSLSMAVLLLVFKYCPPSLAWGMLLSLSIVALFGNQMPILLGAPDYVRSVFVGNTSYHAWPFCPWFVTVFAGVMIAWMRIRWALCHTHLGILLLLAGAVCVIFAVFGGVFPPDFKDSENVIGNKVFIVSPLKLSGLMGMAFVVLGILSLCFGQKDLKPYGVLNSFSKGVLWIYLVHLPLLVRIDTLYGTELGLARRVSKMDTLEAWLIFFGWPLFFLILSYCVGRLALSSIGEWRLSIQFRKIH